MTFSPCVVEFRITDPDRDIWEQLRRNVERQRFRDVEAEAYIENAFWGVPYVSIAAELGMTDAEFLASVTVRR